MSKVLISVLSDHIIPNYLFIKETKGCYDEMLFVTTSYAEQKEIGKHLETTLGLAGTNVRRVNVSNENYQLILEELSHENFSYENEYTINQTGGTKAMSIALFSFFQKFNAHFVYIPIGTNEYFYFKSEEKHVIKYRLSLEEYLSLYGMTCVCDNSLLFDTSYTNKLFERLKKCKFNLGAIPEIYNSQTLPTAEEKRYYGGSWFEEYVYHRIKKENVLSDAAIGMSVKIFRKDSLVNDNEIDVAFVKDNVLNIIECKVSMFGHNTNPKDTVEEYLYKLAAIAKDLGLRVNTYLFTLHKMQKFSSLTLDNFNKRIRILGIRGIYDGNELSQQVIKL